MKLEGRRKIMADNCTLIAREKSRAHGPAVGQLRRGGSAHGANGTFVG